MKDFTVRTLNTSNWSAPLASALAQVSKNFSDRSARKEEADRRELLEVENKRRYEENKALALNEAEESRRRFDIREKRIGKEDFRKEQDRQAQVDLINFVNNKKFSLADRDVKNQELIKNRFENEDREVNSLREMLSGIDKESDSEQDNILLGKALKSATNNLLAGKKDSIQNNKDMMRRLTDLEALKTEFKSTDFKTDKERNDRINEVVNSLYGSKRKNVQNLIEKGVGLSKEQKVRSVLSSLPDNIKSRLLNPSSAKQIISSIVDGPSESDIRKMEQNKVNTSFQNALSYAKAAERQFSVKEEKSSDKKSSKSKEEVLAGIIGKVQGDIGEVSKENTSDYEEAYTHLAKLGYNEYEIENAIMANVVTGFFDDTNLKSLEEIEASARAIKSDYGKNTPDIKSLMAIKDNPRTLAQIALAELGIGDYASAGLNTREQFLNQAEAARAKNTFVESLEDILNQDETPTINLDLEKMSYKELEMMDRWSNLAKIL